MCPPLLCRRLPGWGLLLSLLFTDLSILLFFLLDMSSMSLRLDTLLSCCRLAVDEAADVDLDGGSLLLSLTLQIGEGDSCCCLSGESAASVATRGRLDDDVEDPADSPFPRVSLLLTPFILVPTASGSARPYRSCPGWKVDFIR